MNSKNSDRITEIITSVQDSLFPMIMQQNYIYF